MNYDSSPTTAKTLNNSSNANNNNVTIHLSDSSSDLKLCKLHKIIDDFEWVRNAVSVRRNLMDTLPIIPTAATVVPCKRRLPAEFQMQKKTSQTTIALHVIDWLKDNLTEHNLCAFLQYLVSEKELLEEHYNEDALLRQEIYVTSLVIGLTSFETRQYGLLGQIDAALTNNEEKVKHHKRSNSQPNVIVVSHEQPKNQNVYQTLSPLKTSQQHHSPSVFLTIRRTKSLPQLKYNGLEVQDESDLRHFRPRCKTFGAIKRNTTQPQIIPKYNKKQTTNNRNINQSNSQLTTSSPSSILSEYDDNQPSTSQASSNRSKSPLSNCTLNSNKSIASSLLSTSVSSCNSNTTAKCIQLINTDDIKIWTDHSWEVKQKNKRQEKEQQQSQSASCAIPTPPRPKTKSSKSLSPLNSFFSSLFSTPPSYASWYIDHDNPKNHETTETAIESIIPDNSHHSSQSLGSTVFDKFLPVSVDGKKLRSRKTQNLFEDITAPLDRSGVNLLVTPATSSFNADASSFSTASPNLAKNCQSLTRFLQISHMSRHNTELEKENAHFRISEAIISAIEHIKWNRLETQKDKFNKKG